MNLLKILVYLCFVILLIDSCSENSTESEIENGTQFPAKGEYYGDYWPTEEWRTCAPEEVGMDSALLLKAYNYALNPDFKTQSILISRNGYIIGEAYLNGATINSLFEGYSFAKSFTSALMGIAIDKEYINSVEDYVHDYFSDWDQENNNELKKKVKIKHLLSMTGGLDWNYDSLKIDDLNMLSTGNYIEYILSKDIIYEPGTHWNYSNGEAILISGIFESNKALNMHADAFAYQVLFTKIGIPQIIWSNDGTGLTNTAYGIKATTRQYAKFAYLNLKRGKWENEQIVSKNWILQASSPCSEEFEHYGYYWWLLSGFDNYDQYNVPDSTFFAVGAHGQRMCVVPEENLFVIRLANDSVAEENTWDTLKFLSLVLESKIE